MNEDALEQFHHDRRKKFIHGVNEHRGGNINAPFRGDRRQEYLEEQLDSVNFLEEDLADGIISLEEFRFAAERHFDCWNWRRQRG